MFFGTHFANRLLFTTDLPRSRGFYLANLSSSMHSRRSPQAPGMRRVTLLVPSGCIEDLRRLARELRLRHSAGIATSTAGWRRLTRSAELFVDPQSGAQIVIRGTGAEGTRRFVCTVAVFDQHQIADGRADDAAEARLHAEAALANYLGASRTYRRLSGDG
jgi:hypothetical protein